MSTMCKMLTAWAIGVVWMPAAIAAGAGRESIGERIGRHAGDDALSCDQIYAQGMAETRRDQQERSQRNGDSRVSVRRPARC